MSRSKNISSFLHVTMLVHSFSFKQRESVFQKGTNTRTKYDMLMKEESCTFFLGTFILLHFGPLEKVTGKDTVRSAAMPTCTAVWPELTNQTKV